MEMHMLPLAILLVPNPRLFHRHGGRFAIGDLLRQANISDHGDIAHDPDMRGDDRRLDGIRSAGQVEVVLVEIKSVDQIPHRFGFKTSQTRAT